MSRRFIAIALAAASLAASPAPAAELIDGWRWLSESKEIQTEGAVWNDALGDGKDRWKTGGLTQSYVFPEHIFSDEPWFGDRASALEVNVRGLLITPDNTASTVVDPTDRPYAQYAGAGIYLRSIARPRSLGPGFGLQREARIGVELGWQGDPLPLFDIQESVHDMAGAGGDRATTENSLPSEFLANLDARHTWRYHWDGDDRDVEFAPFLQGSLGMRENSLRAGADLIWGSALEGRTWGSDPATGAMLAGASMHRDGLNWSIFTGADVGYIASDAFLDGGFAANGLKVDREKVVVRVRGGVLLEYDNLGIGFSVNWLGKEFESQAEGQIVGALQLKFRL